MKKYASFWLLLVLAIGFNFNLVISYFNFLGIDKSFSMVFMFLSLVVLYSVVLTHTIIVLCIVYTPVNIFVMLKNHNKCF